MYTLFKRLFFGLLALVSLVVNWRTAPSRSKTPEDAISVVYADTVWGDVKLFLPEEIDPEQPVDLLFTIPGGAWISGSARIFYEHCRQAAAAGYPAASMNYDKIVNGADAARMVEEIGLAIAAVRDELQTRGVPLGKLILVGHSAGAHIMLLYAYTHFNDCPMDIAFVMGNCSPTDFVAAKQESALLGKAANPLLSALTGELITPWTAERFNDAIRAVTPVSFVTPDVPPTIVVYGTKDSLVPMQNSLALLSALRANGVDCAEVAYEGADHFLGAAFAEGNAARSAAFYAFAEKYGS